MKLSSHAVFEPGEDEKNDQEYKKIHEEYKNLVKNTFETLQGLRTITKSKSFFFKFLMLDACPLCSVQ